MAQQKAKPINLMAFQALLQELLELNTSFTASQLMVFTEIASSPGCTTTQVSDILGFKITTTAAIAKDLGDGCDYRPSSFDLIERCSDQLDRRAKGLYLTAKGRKVATVIAKAIK